MTTTEVRPSFYLRPPEKVNLHGQETGRAHVSHSSLTTFLTCQQRFMWAKEERLEPAVTAAPLNMGRAFANALAANDPTVASAAVMEEAAQQWELARENVWITAPDREQVEINAQIVECAARAYLGRYGAARGRELEMRARIRNPHTGGRYSLTHDLVGRVDALDLEASTLIEDKLSSNVQRGTLPARVMLDRQVGIGCYLAWRCYGVEVEKVLYRVTRKPGIRRRKDESHDGYLERIAEEYATKPDEYLIEEPTTRSADDFLRLEQELWTWTEAIRQARRTGVWPRNTDSCHQYAGCKYLAACSRAPGWQHQYVQRKERVA